MRVTLPVTERIFWAAAAEHPFSDVTVDAETLNVQDVPDFTSHLRYDADLFHFQAATVLRTLGCRPEEGSVNRQTGWGVNLSTNFHPWAMVLGTNPLRDEQPSGLTRSRVILQYAFGTGIGRYVQDASGTGLDGALNAAGELETLDISSWTVAYEHWLSDRWMANLAYSQVDMGSLAALPDDSLAGSTYLAATLWWIPVHNMSIGVEYLWGERENLDGGHGRGQRLQTAIQYNF
jgi:hypothetical protein